MSKGIFTNKAMKPSEKDIHAVLGEAESNWNKFVDDLTTQLKLKNELKFYGVNFGWAYRFIKSGKSVIALYPNKDYFTVQIILTRNRNMKHC